MNLEKQLKKEKESLLKRVEAIDILLESYSNNINEEDDKSIPITMEKFPKNGTQLEQIIYIIKYKNRFIHNSELVEIMAPYYIDRDRIWLRARISAVLSIAKSKNQIQNLTYYKYSPSLKDTVWGSKAWLNNEGEIKQEYIPKNKDKLKCENI